MISFTPRLFRRLLVERDGNFGLIFAILIVPLIAVVGISLDLVRLYETKERIQTIADAAVLGAINSTSPAQRDRFVANMNDEGHPWVGIARDDFVAQLRAFDPSITVRAKIRVSRAGTDLISELSYTVTIPTSLSAAIGAGDIEIKGVARARSAPPVFKDFHILVDNSPSMGIGATREAIERMERGVGCAFACHTADGEPGNFYHVSKLGVLLRIDVVRSGIEKIAETITRTRTQPDLYRASLVSLGTTGRINVASKIEELVPLTSDMNRLIEGNRWLGVMTFRVREVPWLGPSDIAVALDILNSRIATPGNGETVKTPQKYVILITDGVQNKLNSPTCQTAILQDNRCIEYMPQSACTNIKNRGIKLAVLYTTYVDVGGAYYFSHVKPFADRIPQALKACASKDLFFEVAPDEGIPEAMQGIFSKLTESPILTD